jgi:hypothetical protein
MIKVKKIKPMFTAIVTTMDKYEKPVMINGLIDTSREVGSIKEYQKVLAVGTSVTSIKIGDLVCVNPSRYAVRKFDENSIKNDIMYNPVTTYNFNVIDIDGEKCLLLQDRDIDFIIEEYEEEQEIESSIIQPKNDIII